MAAIPLQPNSYNYYNPDNPIYIDYENLRKPRLDDLYDEIKKLL